MKEKHIRIRIEQCLALAKASNPRRQLVPTDPKRNVILMDGYNGGPEVVAIIAVAIVAYEIP